jgi:hypothetical protein
MTTETRNNLIAVSVGVVGLLTFGWLWVETSEGPSRSDRRLDRYITSRRAELAKKMGVSVESLLVRPRR